MITALRLVDDEVAAEGAADEARRQRARADAIHRRSVDNAAVGMCLADLKGNFIETNPALCEFFGYDADTLQRMTWPQLTDPDYLEADLDNRAKVVAGEIESYRMVQRFSHADGHPIWGDLAVSCIRDADGQVELFIGQIADITEEVRAREELEEARGLLAASADSMLDPQVLFQAVRDDGGRIVDFTYIGVNRATCLYLGVDEAQLLGASATQSFPNMEGSGLLARYAQCVETGEPVILTDFSYFNEMLDDARRYDIRAARAGSDWLSLTWTDVTERYEAAQRLAASEEKYRLLAINSTDVIVHGRDGKVVWISPSVTDVLGGSPDYWIGRPLKAVVPPDQEAEFDARQKAIAEGRAVQQRTQLIALDGTRHWIHVHSKPFYDREGRPDGFTASLRLIDAQVRQEEKTRRLADRLHAELTSAKEYVTSILPEDLQGEVEITSRYLPAMDLGGDGFHWRWLDDDHLKIYLIDVSGHGIRPALLSVSVQNLIRSDTLPMSTLLRPDRLLAKLNADFGMDDQGGAYFTIWYGVYQKSTRTLHYASAGHPPALALNFDGDAVTATYLSTPSTPIGLFDDATYTTDSYTLPPGAELLIYSDGAYEFEAGTAAGSQMSNKDFAELCTSLAARPDWSLDLLINRLKALSADGGFDDDCTLVLAKFP